MFINTWSKNGFDPKNFADFIVDLPHVLANNSTYIENYLHALDMKDEFAEVHKCLFILLLELFMTAKNQPCGALCSRIWS